jgi:rod shape-determining protein MreC
VALSRRTGRSRLTLALLVLTSLAVLTLDFRDSSIIQGARRVASTAFSPLRGAADTVSEPFSNAWSGVTDYGDLEAENEALREQLDELRGSAASDENAAEQLDAILEQLEIEWVGDIPPVRARVVAGPASNFSHTIEIDKGGDDGFAVGMPVVNGAGLVGKLVQVTSSRSVVQLITDPDFKVGVRLVGDGSLGTAVGTGEGEDLIVDTQLESDAEVAKGTALITSGADDSAFPGDIPVGEVRSTRDGSGGLALDLVVEPLADTTKLSYVTVLLWPAPG